MPISRSERKYLKHKHKGGKSNSQGNDYEDHFSTYKIALLLNAYKNQWKETKITSQIQSFVDDLLIQHPDSRRDYFQLKNVKSLTWNHGKSGHTEHTKQYEIIY